MGRSVSLKEFSLWLKSEKTMRHLWYSDERIEGRSLKMKYINPQLRFSIDTRDLEIWRIDINGIGAASFRDSNDESKTILDEVDEWLEDK